MRNDVFLFDLNDSVALLCDGLQLITARRYRRPNNKPSYKSFAFNRHGRDAFLGDTQRRGIEPTPEALSLIDNVVPTMDEIRRRGERACYADMQLKLEAVRSSEVQDT